MNYEYIGLAATSFVLLSFLMKDAKRIRAINIIGAALFVLYGCLIQSISTAVLNGALILIHAVYLTRENKESEETTHEKNHL